MIRMILVINGEIKIYDETMTHHEAHIKFVEALREYGMYYEEESYIRDEN
jgi:hypothetical protein